MKLPRGDAAIVELRKIREYCLSAEHPRGRHKARVFASVLEMTANDSAKLVAKLLEAARIEEAQPGISDEYGKRFLVDFLLEHKGRQATIRSCWIVLTGEDRPRFVTCYVL